jgi:hypothetical protein
MSNFERIAAQGEITVIRIDDLTEIPATYVRMLLEDGKLIIGHSETGHHHVLSRPDEAEVYVMEDSEGMRILRAILHAPMSLEHLRGFDTHEPLHLEPGAYEFRIAREYDPYAELARQSAD